MSKNFRSAKSRRGQGLVEYIIIVAAVAMISLVSVSIFGHKVADQYAIGAGMLPGAHGEDNLPVAGAQFAESDDDGNGVNTGTGIVSWAGITGPVPVGELQNNVSVTGVVAGETFVAD